MNDILLVLGGLALLVVGGELLVRGAVQAAEKLGISPLLIGLTLVGFGTSTPELVTSVQAALSNSPGIAIGNIVGSNIANILLILGISAIITPITVASAALKRDGILVIGTAAVLTALAFLTPLERWIGVLFIGSLIGYIVYAWRQERTGASKVEGHACPHAKAEAHEAVFGGSVAKPARLLPDAIWVHLLVAFGGLAIVVFGGRWLVEGAIGLARGWGISETVIGLTIVAIGTSMPELVTSIIAALRKQSDVALGNILGSNIYNILGIGGVTALIQPVPVPVEIVRFDNPVMLATSVLLVVLAYTGLKISRREGGVLIAGYGAYLLAIWPK